MEMRFCLHISSLEGICRCGILALALVMLFKIYCMPEERLFWIWVIVICGLAQSSGDISMENVDGERIWTGESFRDRYLRVWQEGRGCLKWGIWIS